LNILTEDGGEGKKVKPKTGVLKGSQTPKPKTN
jgi:hypothetical protein